MAKLCVQEITVTLLKSGSVNYSDFSPQLLGQNFSGILLLSSSMCPCNHEGITTKMGSLDALGLSVVLCAPPQVKLWLCH